MHGNHRRLRHADDGGDVRVPGIVRHPLVGQGKAGGRAGGENAQHAALPQPGDHLAHAGEILALGVLILVHVHLDQPGFQLLAQGKLFVRQNADVLPHAGEQLSEHDAVRQAVRMVGDHDHRPFLGDIFQIPRAQLQLQVQMSGSKLEEILRRTGFLVAHDLVVRLVQAFQAQQLFGGRGHQGGKARILIQNVSDVHHLRVFELGHAPLYNGFTGKSETLFARAAGTQS